MKAIGIGWGAGRGLAAGPELAMQLQRLGRRPVFLDLESAPEITALEQALLAPALEEYRANSDIFVRNHGRRLAFMAMHRLGDGLVAEASLARTPGRMDIGLADFSGAAGFDAAALRGAASLARVLAGSRWAARVLRAHGLTNVVYCPPGVDTARFHPAPRAGWLRGRFALFAGAGEETVLSAFRQFHAHHPEALLLRCGGTGLAPEAGLPAGALIDLGPLPPAELAATLRECALALFAGTAVAVPPPLALQALACGVPAVLPAHSAYLDLGGEHAYMLGGLAGEADQVPVGAVLDVLERAWLRRGELATKGKAAARFARAWDWERQARRLLAAVEAAEAGLQVPAPDAEEDYRWALALHRGGRLAEAEQVYDQVLSVAPEHAGATADRGNVRRDRGNLAGAEADMRALLAAQPQDSRAAHSLGRLLRRAGRPEEAVSWLRTALARMDTPRLHWDLATTLLLAGRFEEAWPHFEQRHAALGLRTVSPQVPRWDGRPVTGATLLVLDEQGLGDTVQFMRFLSRIPRGPGGRVFFAGKPATLELVRRVLPAEDVGAWDGKLPPAQAWVPLMSLPGMLGVRGPEDLPPPDGAVLLDPARADHWRAIVRGPDTRPVVGLCWRGNPDFPDDERRSPGLAALQALAGMAGIRFVSLQVGPGRREIGELGLDQVLADVGGAVEAVGASALDTVAVLSHCDLVVSCCTSVAHLAGTLGRPGLVLLAHQPDWRWMLGRDDTPWYPSLRLLRQSSEGDWAAVERAAMDELTRRFKR